MSAWRSRPACDRPQAWCIQETHVKTSEEAQELCLTWARMWGKHRDGGHPPLSYWSVGSSRLGGVAILLTPSSSVKASPWRHDLWNTRTIAVSLDDVVLVNVYAPSLRPEREAYYISLARWNFPRDSSIVTGDFNCVQSPLLDRLGHHRSCRPESPSLQAFLDLQGLEDARLLRYHAEDEEADDCVDHFTYWEGESASRIDRFYVSQRWADLVLWLAVRTPPQASDHQEVELHLRVRQRPTSTLYRRPVSYPIQTHQPERVRSDLIAEMDGWAVSPTTTVRQWDSAVEACKHCIKTVRKRERQRRARFKKRVSRRDRRQLLTRPQWISANMEDHRLEHLVRLGQSLERTTARLRWSFKRVADWERDQTVTNIARIHGPSFGRHMSIADKFASEWSPVLSVVHRVEPLAELPRAMLDFVSVPNDRLISTAANNGLMVDVTENEVLQAITELSRHKASGPDGLNNDFYKDTSALLAPVLVHVCNQILHGSPMPPSFLEALIIPLRKKGDSPDALDYRPISLLQTSYKIFAKVLASRLQRVLPTIIGESQQGFVRGRQMQKLIMMMTAQLASAEERTDLSADLSRAILLLDFRKAYDTVDRDFLYAALRSFQFDEVFIKLVTRMHTGTTARFLVNGELSEPVPVRSGIRQGCPLAPLLFLLVVELLGLAIHQAPSIRGIPVPGACGVAHTFSAFVDDSTIFLEHANQLAPALELVSRFGQLSGLHAQPAKSKLIFFKHGYQAPPV